jgi:hypothetical protein
MTRSRHHVYQALADHMEDALEEHEDTDRAKERQRDGRRSYIRRLLTASTEPAR